LLGFPRLDYGDDVLTSQKGVESWISSIPIDFILFLTKRYGERGQVEYVKRHIVHWGLRTRKVRTDAHVPLDRKQNGLGNLDYYARNPRRADRGGLLFVSVVKRASQLAAIFGRRPGRRRA
jgi:hypothetical protein